MCRPAGGGQALRRRQLGQVPRGGAAEGNGCQGARRKENLLGGAPGIALETQLLAESRVRWENGFWIEFGRFGMNLTLGRDNHNRRFVCSVA